jgi:hypothetical protein
MVLTKKKSSNRLRLSTKDKITSIIRHMTTLQQRLEPLENAATKLLPPNLPNDLYLKRATDRLSFWLSIRKISLDENLYTMSNDIIKILRNLEKSKIIYLEYSRKLN